AALPGEVAIGGVGRVKADRGLEPLAPPRAVELLEKRVAQDEGGVRLVGRPDSGCVEDVCRRVAHHRRIEGVQLDEQIVQQVPCPGDIDARSGGRCWRALDRASMSPGHGTCWTT